MTRRSLLILSLLIGSTSLTAASNANAADANIFMSELWTRAVEVLDKKAPLTERLTRFRQLFEAYVIFVYGTRLSHFNGETFKVRGSRTDESGTVVSTDIISPSGEPPIKVDWRLVADRGAFKINDVIIEGISMMVTQRSEFASIIQRHGGQVGGLLALMREKTNTASAAQ